MSRLILHIGPGKCGSTSIQNLFALHSHPCVERTFFYLLAPGDFTDLEDVEPNAGRLKRLDSLLAKAKAGGDIAILSHEFLFQTPRAMGIITAHARKIFDDIRIIGYVRPQSSLLRSSYSQWLFRAPGRVAELDTVLQSHGYNPDLFTGLERQYIAAILDNYHSARQLSGYRLLDLRAGYRSLETHCDIKPIVGGLPRDGSSLWSDFCDKAGLNLKAGLSETRANTRFHPHLVDGITEAIRAGHAVIGPHEGNERLIKLSERMVDINSFNAAFLKALTGRIDMDFADDNHLMCRRYNIDYNKFYEGADKEVGDIFDVINTTHTSRAADPSSIINYLEFIANDSYGFPRA